MSLDVKEFSNMTGVSPHLQQPPTGGASLTTAGAFYTVGGPGMVFVELYANGVGHVFTVSDSAVAQAMPAGERVVYGMRGGARVTLTA